MMYENQTKVFKNLKIITWERLAITQGKSLKAFHKPQNLVYESFQSNHPGLSMQKMQLQIKCTHYKK